MRSRYNDSDYPSMPITPQQYLINLKADSSAHEYRRLAEAVIVDAASAEPTGEAAKAFGTAAEETFHLNGKTIAATVFRLTMVGIAAQGKVLEYDEAGRLIIPG